MYALWVRSHADLPILLYQVVNTFRYETKHTRPLIRLREITSFKEAHTVHATWEQAEIQVEKAIALYQEFYAKLCIPVVVSKRPEWDKFPGADYTMAVDTIMPDGKTLQIGTVHHLGDHFSQTFSITFEDPEGLQRHAYQTCYGISERSIAALISLHGDDKGLVLPPEMAPVQVVIVPITIGKRKDDVASAALSVESTLKSAGYRVKTDNRDQRPGAKYYYWEMRGVPVRLEVGPRDIDSGVVTVVTRTGERTTIPVADLLNGIKNVLSGEQARLRERTESHMRSRLIRVVSMEEAANALAQGVAVVNWCGERGCADAMEERLGASVLGTEARSPYLTEMDGGCIICGKPGKTTLLGRAY
jgi:prolyl-tRNA synthetase